jgi:hypothetical protein
MENVAQKRLTFYIFQMSKLFLKDKKNVFFLKLFNIFLRSKKSYKRSFKNIGCRSKTERGCTSK